METKPIFPHYAKTSLVIIGLFAAVAVLYVAKEIISPLVFATIIAITLSPLVDFFVKKKMNSILAISISLVLVSAIFIGLIVLLSAQLNDFTNALPALLDRFYEALNNIVLWASKYLNISTEKINGYIVQTKTEIVNNSGAAIGGTLNTILRSFSAIVLIPVYVFMILFYRPMLLDFIRKLFGKKNLEKVNEILSLTKSIIQRYLIALLIETAIIAVLNSVGLLIIGIKYAIVLGIIGALLNLIPYIGGLIAIVLYIIVALLTKDSILSVFYVLVLYSVIQLIDNNLIVPKLVGAKVKINALVAIVGVIVGGALWGISGMFLSIPIIAILKIVFDRIEGLTPWGFLLGDDMPSIFEIKPITKKITK